MLVNVAVTDCMISIHALREEGDPPLFVSAQTGRRFLSTPSARRATGLSTPLWRAISNFYPRPPRGGRRRAGILEGLHADFYPRPPRGGRRCRWSSIPLSV